MGEIRKQGIANSVITYAGILIGFVNIGVIQPNFLNPEELGLTRILFSFSALLATIMPLGLGNITIRFFPLLKNPENRNNGYFGFLLLVGLIGFILLASLLWLIKPYILQSFPDQTNLLADFFHMVFPLMLFLGFNSLLNTYCYSLFKTSLPSLINDVIIRIGSIVIVAVYYMKWLSFDSFIIFFVGIYGFQALMLIGYIFIIDKPGFKINFLRLRELGLGKMLNYGLVMSVASLSSLGLRYIDTIFVGKFLDLTMVAIYTVAALIPTIIEAPLLALEKIASPKIAAAWAKKNTEEIKKIYYDSSLYLLLIGGLLFVGININISDLFKIVPKDYSLGVNVVFLISLSTMFNMATGVNNSVIFTSEYFRWGAGFLYLLIVLIVVTNILFIPVFGLLGAALATMVSGFFYNFLKFLFIRQKFGMNPFNLRSLQLLILIIIILVLGFLIPSTKSGIADIILRTFIVSLVYISGAYYLKIAPGLFQLLKDFIAGKTASVVIFGRGKEK